MVKFLILFLLTLSCGCAVTTQIPLQENTSNNLKLDGFYYSIIFVDVRFIGNVRFLFKNGVLLDQGSKVFSSRKELIKSLENISERESWIFSTGPKTKEMFGLWGTYTIEKDTIYFMVQDQGQGNMYRESKGEIISDRTFIIKERKENKKFTNTPVPGANGLNYFIPTSSKPDSTNKFFK